MIEKLSVISLRILMLAALVMAGRTIFGRLVAYEILRTNPPLEGLNVALDYDGRNPDIHYVRALLVLDDPGLSSLDLAGSDLEASIRLNPYNSRYWEALAQYREVTGKKEEANEAYRRAVELNPQSGIQQWQWANFLLRNGNQNRAFAAMKRAIHLRPELRNAAAQMLLRMQVPASQVTDIWPSGPEANLQLLQYCVKSFPESEEVWGKALEDRLWNDLLKSRPPLEPGQAAFYMKFLFDKGRYRQLRSAWVAFWQARGLDVDEFAGKADYCWNGGFESELETTPLGWRISDARGVRVRLDRQAGDSGNHSLRVDFDGTQNIDFRHVSQEIIVYPGRAYQLSFKARSENLKPHEGVFVEISDGKNVLAATEPMLGTTPWKRFTASISAGPDTELVRITVRRRRSYRIDSLIKGSVWFDDFKLLPFKPSQ